MLMWRRVPAPFRLDWLFTVKDMFTFLSAYAVHWAHSDTGTSLSVAMWRWAEALPSALPCPLGRLVCSLTLPSMRASLHKSSSAISTCHAAVVQTQCSLVVVPGPLLMCSFNQPTEGAPCTTENASFPCVLVCFLPCFQCHATSSCSFLQLCY